MNQMKIRIQVKKDFNYFNRDGIYSIMECGFYTCEVLQLNYKFEIPGEMIFSKEIIKENTNLFKIEN